jgi:hypothetical protein
MSDSALVAEFEQRRDARRRELGLVLVPAFEEGESVADRVRKIGETRGFAPEPEEIAAAGEPQAFSAVACGAPSRYRFCLRSNWKGAWHLPDWSGDPWSLTILGRPGRGKTHSATALFDELASARGRRAWWLSWPEAVTQMKAEFTAHEPGTVSVRAKLEDDRLLLLDDVGAIYDPKGFANGELMAVVLYRYNRELPTIITSNAESMADFAKIDERIASRLSAGIVVTCPGDDYRRKPL